MPRRVTVETGMCAQGGARQQAPTHRCFLLLVVVVLYTTSIRNGGTDAARHSDESASVISWGGAKCIDRDTYALHFGVGGLTAGARYHLTYYLRSTKSDEIERRTWEDDNVLSGHFQLAPSSADGKSIQLAVHIPNGLSGSFHYEAFLVDEFPGLSAEEAILATRSGVVSIDALPDCGHGTLHMQLESTPVESITFWPGDERSSPALMQRIAVHNPHNMTVKADVKFQLISGHEPAYREYRQNFSFVQVVPETGVEEDGRVLVRVRLPRRGWPAASFRVSLNLLVQDGSQKFRYIRNQVMQLEGGGWSIFRHSTSDWCNVSVGFSEQSFGAAKWSTTLVTAFWSPDDMAKGKRNEESYWPWIDNVLSVESPVIIYTSKQLQSRFMTSGNWSSGPRCVRILEIGQFEMHRWRGDLEQMVKRDPESFRYSLEYSMIMHEKPHLLATAAEQNPFTTDFFLWVDAGGDRTGFLRGKSWPQPERMAVAADKIIVLDIFGAVSQFLSTQASDLTSDEQVINATTSLAVFPNVGLTGTIFGGSARAVSALNMSYYPTLASFLKRGAHCMSEQVIMSGMSISARTRSSFHVVQEDVPAGVRDFFFLLRYLSSDQPGTRHGITTSTDVCKNTAHWWSPQPLEGNGLLKSLCRALRIDPEPLGRGHEVTVFRACTDDGHLVALHVPFRRANRLSGFQVLARQQDAGFSSPHVLRVHGICTDTGAFFEARQFNGQPAAEKEPRLLLHIPPREAKQVHVNIGVTEYLHPKYVRFDEYTRQLARPCERCAVSDRRASAQTTQAGDRHVTGALWELAALATQLFDGICELASHGLLHGDFKPINILVDTSPSASQPCAKIVDMHQVERFDVMRDANLSCCFMKPCAEGSERPGEVTDVSTCPPECAACERFAPDVEATWNFGFVIAWGLADIFDVPLPYDKAAKSTSLIPGFFVKLASVSNATWEGRELTAIAKCTLHLERAKRCRLAEIRERLGFFARSRQVAVAASILAEPDDDSCNKILSATADVAHRIYVDMPIPIVVKVLPYCLSAQIIAELRSESQDVLWSSVVIIHRGLGVATAVVPGDSWAASTNEQQAKICLTLSQGDSDLYVDCELAVDAFKVVHCTPDPASGHLRMSANAANRAGAHVTGGSASDSIPCQIPESDDSVSHGSSDADIVWGPAVTVTVSNDVIISEGQTLTILPGTRIRVNADGDGKMVNFFIAGTLICTGSARHPIVFSGGNSVAWGSLRVSGHARIMHTFFFDGGADETFKFGHSSSQAVLMALPDSDVHVLYGGFVDNVGKAAGFHDAKLMMLGVKIYRCDLGVEGSSGAMTLVDSDLSQFPDHDQVEDDDDNDALRLSKWSTDGVATIIDNCRLSYGDDDAIDQETAHVVVRNCDISRFINAGVAASGWGYGKPNGRIHVFSTVIQRCAQGLEVGYGATIVSMDSVVLAFNKVGLVFGDEYEHGFGVGHHGFLRATNSIIVRNEVNYANSFPEYPYRRPSSVRLDQCVLVGEAMVLEYLQVLANCGACWEANACIDGKALDVQPARAHLYCAALSAVLLREAKQHQIEVAIFPLRDATSEIPSRMLVQVDRVHPITPLEQWHADIESFDTSLGLSISYSMQGCQFCVQGSQQVPGSERSRTPSMQALVRLQSPQLGCGRDAGLLLRVKVSLDPYSIEVVRAEVQWQAPGGARDGAGEQKEGEELEHLSKQVLNKVLEIKAASCPDYKCDCLDTRGLTMKVLAQLPSGAPFVGADWNIVLKSATGVATHFDAEFHGREAMSYCLDRSLGTKLVPPCVVLELSREALLKVVETEVDRESIANHTMCPSVMMNASHLTWSASTRVPNLLQMSPEDWDALSQPPVPVQRPWTFQQFGGGHSAGLAVSFSNLAEYVVFHFVANCMRSSHNHHFAVGNPERLSANRDSATSFAARLVSVDNDRCFVPEAVSTAAHVPKTHRWRAEQWLPLVKHPTSQWPLKLVQKVVHLAARKGAITREISECMGAHLHLVPDAHQVLEEMEERMRTLAWDMLNINK
jgi:hypothetical protein